MGDDGSSAISNLPNNIPIWSQQAESCDCDSMPICANETGRVSFTGSPEQLAINLVETIVQKQKEATYETENYGVASQESTAGQNPSIDCLLVPIRDGHLILPNASIAEIIPFSHLLTTNARVDWILGRLDWRNTLVPAVCYELLNGSAPPAPNADARFIVVNSISGNNDLAFYAILVQGIRRLVHLQEDDIQTNDTKALGNLEKSLVRVNDIDAVIPDLEKLESEMVVFVRN